nr:MAG: class I SAM-dependent methyltransferase [Chloroflexota bacterium]
MKKKFNQVRKRGFKYAFQSLAYKLQDHFFDLKYGTDTGGKIWTPKVAISVDYLEKGRSYKATRLKPIHTVLNELSLSRELPFVDVGSGKGRVLLLAMEYGFQKITGIEYSGALCKIAEENVRAYQKRTGSAADIRIYEMDATRYEFEGEESVLYLFNPLNHAGMEVFFYNVQRSLEAHDRELWIIYNNPKHGEFMKSLDFLEEHRIFILEGEKVVVYLHQPYPKTAFGGVEDQQLRLPIILMQA